MAHPYHSSGSVANNKRFEFITAVLLTNQFFWDVMICWPVKSYWGFQVQWCLNFHSQAVCILVTDPRDYTTCNFRMPIGKLTHPIFALSHFLYHFGIKNTVTLSTHHGPRQLSRYSDLLRAGRSGDRIPVWGARFSALVQTGTGAHIASYTMGTGSFPGESGRGVYHPPHLTPRLKKE